MQTNFLLTIPEYWTPLGIKILSQIALERYALDQIEE